MNAPTSARDRMCNWCNGTAHAHMQNLQTRFGRAPGRVTGTFAAFFALYIYNLASFKIFRM